MEIILSLALIFLVFSHFGLRKKVKNLEARMAALRGAEPQVAGTDDAPVSDQIAATTPTAAAEGTGPWGKSAVKEADDETVNIELPPREIIDDTPPKAFVLKPENIAKAGKWLAQNWFLAVAALSLALAGVFMVQYGVEQGLITPFWRVMGAAFLGIALIGAGEFVRRRWGDGDQSHTAYLPSTFAGAGLVALFAAVLAARQMYGLIGSETALIYLVMVSIVAIVLGWYYGPYLAVVGILGSLAAPFLVGGESSAPQLFFYYFAIVVVAALAVDTVKRWAWVSVLALVFGYIAAFVIFDKSAGDEHFLAFALITAVASVTIPQRSLWPSHDGATVLSVFGQLRRKGDEPRTWPEFPTRLAAGAFAAAAGSAMLVVLKDAGQAEVWLAIAVLSVLYLAAVVWFRGAKALDDLAIIPAVLLVGVVVVQVFDWGSLYKVFNTGLERPPETSPPNTVSVLAALGLAGSSLAFWRTLWGGARMQAWAAGAALFAPLMLVTLEFWWGPEPILGAGRWAAHAMIIAAVMVFFAERVARRDGEDHRRVAYFALSALTMISFALVIMLSSSALTLALAVMVLGAALIDKRLNLPLLSIFVQVGVIVVGWRLVLEPGIFWGSDAPIWEVVLAYLGSAGLLAAAWITLASRGRDTARMTVESGIWAILGVFTSLMLYRWLGGDVESHWGLSLIASVWLILMLVQLYRLQAGGWLRWVRIGLASIYSVMALFLFLVVFLVFNPLDPFGFSYDPVIGPPVFDSLLVAFGLPALILALGVWKLPHIRPWLRKTLISLSAIFAITYVGFEIRRLWRGNDLSVSGASAPELYSYTIAMIVAAVALLFLAFNRRSLPLRRIATIGIGLTIAKVFLIDMSGLTGLLRVASFLGLGLSLAGLGWLYRRMAAQWDPVEVPGEPVEEPSEED